jgi:Na+-transporting methylmalonyl-CoA/oxaloacetate decarboxylase gamma subunit
MLDQFAGLGIVFALLTFIAMLVRYERRLSRWLLKGSRKRRKPLVVQVVR